LSDFIVPSGIAHPSKQPIASSIFGVSSLGSYSLKWNPTTTMNVCTSPFVLGIFDRSSEFQLMIPFFD
jgi:hypothetical protein